MQNPVGPPVFASAQAGGVRLRLLVQPRASRTELAGVVGDRLKVRVAGPPVDGEANAELCRFLARSLRVPKSGIHIVSGETGRRKEIAVDGLSVADALAQLGLGCG